MKFVLYIFMLIGVVCLQANEYRYVETVELAKDEHKIFIVKYDKSEKIFKFRWTLYTNGGLVILRSYDRIVAQHVLYSRYNRRSIRVELKPRGVNLKPPYVLIKFVEYDFAKNKAILKLFLSDDKLEVGLEHLENE